MNARKKIGDSLHVPDSKPGTVLQDAVKALKAEKFARKANRSASKKGSLRDEDKKDAERWRNEG